MFFLYHNKSYKTGRVLASSLGLPFARNARRVPVEEDILIRWGNTQPLQVQEEINNATAINNASDKLRALRLLQEAGIRVPRFENYSDNFAGDGVVYLGRNRRGFGGQDIVVYEAPREYPFTPHDFFTEYIEPRFEARIHVAFGEVIRVQKKYLDHPEQASNTYVRNYANGYRFRSPARELNDSRKEAAIRAVEALGLHFGAVDIVVGTDDLEYVLEVNTAPKCSPLTGRAYTGAIVRELKRRGVWPPDREPNFEALERLNENARGLTPS